jgi:hypothetical protein
MSRKLKDFKRVREKSNKRKIRNFFLITIVLIPFLYVALNIIKWPIFNILIDKYGVNTKGIIVNEKNISGKGVITKMYTYNYEFEADGEKYYGDSKNSNYKIGNTVEVEYLIFFPKINRIKK